MSLGPTVPLHEQLRQKNIGVVRNTTEWDMVVIGGGITGAGVVREAARQGLSVLLLKGFFMGDVKPFIQDGAWRFALFSRR